MPENAPGTEMVVVPNIQMTGKLDTNDLLAIPMANIESHIATRVRAITARQMVIKKEVEAFEKKITDALNKFQEEKTKDKISEIKVSFLSNGSRDVQISKGCEKGMDDKGKKVLFIHLTMCTDRNSDFSKKSGEFHLRFNGSVDARATFPYPPDITKIEEDKKVLETEYKTITDEGVELKKINLPQIERQVRAKLASAVLQTTEQGKAMLEQMSNIDSLYEFLGLQKALPARKK